MLCCMLYTINMCNKMITRVSKKHKLHEISIWRKPLHLCSATNTNKPNMRQTVMALALWAVLPITAHGGNPEAHAVEKAIRREVHYPDFARIQKLNGVVMVQYEIGWTGRISVLAMDATHPELADYVRRKMEAVRLSQEVEPGVRHARFTFRYAGQ